MYRDVRHCRPASILRVGEGKEGKDREQPLSVSACAVIVDGLLIISPG
jgi:hypothetical protein